MENIIIGKANYSNMEKVAIFTFIWLLFVVFSYIKL